MQYEQLALERQNVQEKINLLEFMIRNMEADFAMCAKGMSPCLFCENDKHCNAVGEHGCCFKWKSHK